MNLNNFEIFFLLLYTNFSKYAIEKLKEIFSITRIKEGKQPGSRISKKIIKNRYVQIDTTPITLIQRNLIFIADCPIKLGTIFIAQ